MERNSDNRTWFRTTNEKHEFLLEDVTGVNLYEDYIALTMANNFTRVIFSDGVPAFEEAWAKFRKGEGNGTE